MAIDVETSVDLFGAIARGDERALRALYRARADWVYAIALRLLGDSSAAEDVVQDTFVKIWRLADRFDATLGSERAWIAVIARNTALDHVRRRRPTESLGATELEITFEPADPPDPKLQKCLSCLPHDQAHAIVTMYRHGFSHTELAEHLSVPVGTVKSRVLRGTQSLRKCMDAPQTEARLASEPCSCRVEQLDGSGR